MKEAYADKRRTEISDVEFEHDIEDLIQKEDMVVTVTVVISSVYLFLRIGLSGVAVRAVQV